MELHSYLQNLLGLQKEKEKREHYLVMFSMIVKTALVKLEARFQPIRIDDVVEMNFLISIVLPGSTRL